MDAHLHSLAIFTDDIPFLFKISQEWDKKEYIFPHR